jgi:hypothetical protein
MAYYDLLCFLEYYADRSSVYDPSTGKRAPTRRWQNFYQVPQDLSVVDSTVQGSFTYIPFRASGFGLTAADAVNELTVEIAATADIIDLTDAAISPSRLVIASLYLQDAGKDQLDAASAVLVNRYIGGIDGADVTDTAVSWSVTPVLDKTKPQIPTRKIASDLIGRFVGR